MASTSLMDEFAVAALSAGGRAGAPDTRQLFRRADGLAVRAVLPEFRDPRDLRRDRAAAHQRDCGLRFARLRFPGRDRVFLGFLSVLMVPAIVLLLPRFLIVNALGWVDSYAA